MVFEYPIGEEQERWIQDIEAEQEIEQFEKEQASKERVEKLKKELRAAEVINRARE